MNLGEIVGILLFFTIYLFLVYTIGLRFEQGAKWMLKISPPSSKLLGFWRKTVETCAKWMFPFLEFDSWDNKKTDMEGVKKKQRDSIISLTLMLCGLIYVIVSD